MTTMKAAAYYRYGPPEVISIVDIKKPEPGPNEVLVRVYAGTVNRTDCGFRTAEYFVSRFFSGLFNPKINVLGCEYAGQIEGIGDKVTAFKVGDRVFGFNDGRFGGHGQYVTRRDNEAMALIPDGLSYEEAAPISEGGHYALSAITAAKAEHAKHVMVYGATGAIGSAAVQLLKHFGAKVTAVCNTRNVELVKKLGADVVVDYQNEDFTNTDERFDFVFDAVGKSSFGACRKILKEKGIYASTELGRRGENIYLSMLTPFFGGKKVVFPMPSKTREHVLLLKQLVEAGKFKPLIDRVYPLSQIVEAARYVETGQKTGCVVITIP
jgi:NADPH:quinone reductase-like Zn-dependent oxidoreductase